MLKKMFKCVDDINNIIGNKVLEIEVKQSKICIEFSRQDLILLEDIEALNSLCENYSITTINALDGRIQVYLDNLTEGLIDDSAFGKLHNVIFQLADSLCTCPALTYAISDSYLKVYIDVPNVHISNLENVRKLFNNDGLLELGMHKPYLLFVKDW